MGEIEPIHRGAAPRRRLPQPSSPTVVTFDRRELDRNLDLYGRMVAAANGVIMR